MSTLRHIKYFIIIFTGSIDARDEDGSLGRLVNDDHRNPNANIRIVVYEDKPHLCLFAVGDIPANTEIRYSYGDHSDGHFPWRSMVSKYSFCCLY